MAPSIPPPRCNGPVCETGGSVGSPPRGQYGAAAQLTEQGHKFLGRNSDRRNGILVTNGLKLIKARARRQQASPKERGGRVVCSCSQRHGGTAQRQAMDGCFPNAGLPFQS